MKNIYFVLVVIAAFTISANAQKTTDLAKTNFRNYTFKVDGKTVKLKDGVEATACAEKDPEGIPTGDIWSLPNDKPALGDLDGDGRDEAIVTLVANICGGTMITNEAIVVLTVTNGRITQLPAFDYFDDGCVAGEPGCNFARNPGAGARYDAKTKAIVVETSFATDDDAACCPSLSRETWYKWNGTAFVEFKRGAITKKPE